MQRGRRHYICVTFFFTSNIKIATLRGNDVAFAIVLTECRTSTAVILRKCKKKL